MMASNHMQSSILDSSTEMPARSLSTNWSGRKEHLYTNHFTCSLNNNIPLYQYDVTIEEMDSKSGDWKECEGRSRCTTLMQSIISNNQSISNVFVWYDGQKFLYSTSELTPQSVTNNNGRNRLNIKSLFHQCSTNDINDYIHEQTETYPYDAVRIVEALLRRSLHDRIKTVKNKCYFLETPSIRLGNGFEQRHGFIQALNLSSRLLTLNIQSNLTTFYSSIPLLEFIHLRTGSSRMPSDHDYEKLNRILKNCLIVTQSGRWKKEYIFDRFDYRRAYEIQFESGKLLIDYYQEEKNITLRQINYPCVQVYSRNNYTQLRHLPIEVCTIKEWQVYDKQLSTTEEGRKGIPTPEERYYQIIETLHECDYNSNLFCQAIGFHIDIEEMLQFDTRILPPPKIKSGLHYEASVDNGSVYLGGHICVPKLISTLAITYFGANVNQNKSNFEQSGDRLVDVMESYNVYGRHEEHFVAPVFDDINGYFRSMSEQNCQFIVCAMDGRNEDDLTQLRINIKKCGTITHGIMTQCIVFSETPTDEPTLNSYCENLVRKINFKNGGINTIVDLDIALKDKKSPDDFYMFFGGSVLYPANTTRQNPSIAAIVGSGNSSCSTTAARVCKQYPKEGKWSVETIVGMTEMIEQLLDYYHQTNQHLPTKIVFYRDGIDEGQFRKVLDFEVPAIRAAFNQIYGDNKDKHPLLTLIVVKKRHNTRFFTYNPYATPLITEEGPVSKATANMAIGSVIDTTIVHPYQHNFYLNSHNVDRGVNNPSLYHVLLDEIGFTADELQLLTYYLCYTDPRSSTSEAIPSVVHQAGVAASNARDLFLNEADSSTINSAERSPQLQNPGLENLEYEILQVHQTLRNKPWFA